MLFRYRFSFLLVLALAGGLIIGWRLGINSIRVANEEIHADQAGYTFTNPLLACEISEHRINIELPSAKQEVERVINQAKMAGDIINASVYFRDLNNGWWFDINSESMFKPASLLKLPLAITHYKQAEITPELLNRVVKYEKPHEQIDNFKLAIPPEQAIQTGQSYTISDLINRMLLYSDNQAAGLLTALIPNKLISQTFIDFNNQDPFDPSSQGEYNVKDYASFFRILFNSSYLNRKSSELLLGSLTATRYKEALVSGVPLGVKVAHKFGEGSDTQGRRELHDCGIVYMDSKPYLLCIMTKGDNLTGLQKTISLISKTVYDVTSHALAKTNRQ
jgi:hypothetical protein